MVVVVVKRMTVGMACTAGLLYDFREITFTVMHDSIGMTCIVICDFKYDLHSKRFRQVRACVV